MKQPLPERPQIARLVPSVPGWRFAELAGVTGGAVSRSVALTPARTKGGKIRMWHPVAWRYLASHPFTRTADGDLLDCPAGFLRPALAKRSPDRDEDGDPLLQTNHPAAVAFAARCGAAYHEWFATGAH